VLHRTIGELRAEWQSTESKPSERSS